MTSSPSNTSWVKTIKSPFRKARTLFNNNNQSHHASTAATPTRAHKRNKSRQPQGQDDDKKMIDLQLEGEVMACTYEDVQVMWSILDKANKQPRSSLCNSMFLVGKLDQVVTEREKLSSLRRKETFKQGKAKKGNIQKRVQLSKLNQVSSSLNSDD